MEQLRSDAGAKLWGRVSNVVVHLDAQIAS